MSDRFTVTIHEGGFTVAKNFGDPESQGQLQLKVSPGDTIAFCLGNDRTQDCCLDIRRPEGEAHELFTGGDSFNVTATPVRRKVHYDAQGTYTFNIPPEHGQGDGLSGDITVQTGGGY
jgi:hypothetical protein